RVGDGHEVLDFSGNSESCYRWRAFRRSTAAASALSLSCRRRLSCRGRLSRCSTALSGKDEDTRSGNDEQCDDDILFQTEHLSSYFLASGPPAGLLSVQLFDLA